jgi:hypothetical protein
MSLTVNALRFLRFLQLLQLHQQRQMLQFLLGAALFAGVFYVVSMIVEHFIEEVLL